MLAVWWLARIEVGGHSVFTAVILGFGDPLLEAWWPICSCGGDWQVVERV
jgi:hypothetical protein